MSNLRIAADSFSAPTPVNILPAETEIAEIFAVERKSEPIKSVEDVYRISEYFIAEKRYRDNMLFIVGVNFGLRVSDLISLRFSQLITSEQTFKEDFLILEQKTANTRKVQSNRHITLNTAVEQAIALYLDNAAGVTLSDYMFRGEGNRSKNSPKPITRQTVDRIIKDVCKTLQVPGRIATHTLRKAFAYHQMLMSGNDPRKLLLLQKILGHSSTEMTLAYIGITDEEIAEAYQSLSLGQVRHRGVLGTPFEVISGYRTQTEDAQGEESNTLILFDKHLRAAR